MTTPALSRPPGAAVAPTWRQLVAFHLALPVLLSFPQGWSQVGPAFSLPVSLVWWACTWLVAWTLNELFSRGAAAALRPWRPPLWAVLLVGSVLAGFTSRWWTVPLFDLVTLLELPADADRYRETPRDLRDPVYLARLAQALVAGSVAWLVANYLYERISGVPRFADATLPRAWMRPAVPTATEANLTPAPPGPVVAEAAPVPAEAPRAIAAPAEPRFLARMTRFPGLRLEDVLAIEAEDHYVKVHTTRGAELVYYRFADALDDLRAHDGLQVHRSFWVRRGAIERVETGGRQWQLRLTGGLCVPVSRSNYGALRLAGFAR